MQNDIDRKIAASEQNSTSGCLPDWMMFPNLAEVFKGNVSKTISVFAAKRDRYRSLAEAGTAVDRIHARMISLSYARTYALLEELERNQCEGKREESHSFLQNSEKTGRGVSNGE